MSSLLFAGWVVALMTAETAGELGAQPDLGLRAPTTPEPADDAKAAAQAPWGFYRDRQGRVMQVSFDLGRRLWLGVGYAPHRTPAGQTEISPAAFDFGV